MYEKLALFYDSLVLDVDYEKIAGYAISIMERDMEKKASVKILDAGCGTGSFILEMKKAGYDPDGFDISQRMVDAANKKLSENGFEPRVHWGDMTEITVENKYDAVFSLLDSINYVIGEEKLLKTFKNIRKALKADGLFIFDINTPYKFKNMLKESIFYEIGDEICYLWNCAYNTKSHEISHELNFFIKEGDLYRRFEERHIQKIYESETVQGALKEAGFSEINVYDDLTFRKPKEKSLRIYFVCKI